MKKMLTLCILLCMTLVSLCAQNYTPEEQRTLFLEQCKSYLGTPYKYGGITASGMDCSGFIYTSAKESLGMKLPRRAEDLYNSTERIDKSQLQPGDFLFFKAANTVNHAAVYLGNDQFIHSASDGPKTGVIISKLSDSYWNTTFVGCGKFLPVATHPEKIGQSVEKAEAVQTQVAVAEPVPVAMPVAEEPKDDYVAIEAVPAGTENQEEAFTAVPVPGTISAGAQPSAAELELARQKEQLAAQEAALAQARAQAEAQEKALAEAQAQAKAAQAQADAYAKAQAEAQARAQAEAQERALAEAQAQVRAAQAQAEAYARAQAEAQAAQTAQLQMQNQSQMSAVQETTAAAREAAAAAKEATAAAREAAAAAKEATAAAKEATQASKEAIKVADTSYRSILSFPDVTISTDNFIY